MNPRPFFVFLWIDKTLETIQRKSEAGFQSCRSGNLGNKDPKISEIRKTGRAAPKHTPPFRVGWAARNLISRFKTSSQINFKALFSLMGMVGPIVSGSDPPALPVLVDCWRGSGDLFRLPPPSGLVIWLTPSNWRRGSHRFARHRTCPSLPEEPPGSKPGSSSSLSPEDKYVLLCKKGLEHYTTSEYAYYRKSHIERAATY